MSQALIGKFTRTFAQLVTTKVQQLCAEDPNRICIFVQNLGSAPIYILSAQNMTAADGIQVAANGGTYKNDTTTAPLWIVAASGTNDVRVQVDGC